MQTLTIDNHNLDGVLIMRMHGHLKADNPSLEVFRSTLRRALQDGSRHFIFNLEDVSYVDSMGLSALIRGYHDVQADRGIVLLAGLRKRQLDLLVITKLVTQFEVFTSELEALATFRVQRAVNS